MALSHRSREALQRLVAALSVGVPTPAEDATDEIWDQWMRAMELDSLLAGWVASAAAGGRVSRAEALAAREELAAHPEWRTLLGSRYDVMLEAAEALLGL